MGNEIIILYFPFDLPRFGILALIEMSGSFMYNNYFYGMKFI